MTKTPAPTSEAPTAPFFRVNQTENLPETGQLKHGKQGKDFCIYLPPADFLLLCPKLKNIFADDLEIIENAIGWLKGSGTGVLNLWLREIRPKSEIRRFIVDSHDGRHRAAAAFALDIKRVPVKIRIVSDVWDAEYSDFVDSYGTVLIVPQISGPILAVSEMFKTSSLNRIYLKNLKNEINDTPWYARD